MHEVGIANSILEATRAEMAGHAGARPLRVTVRIGELAGVDADSLQFCFAALTRDTELATLELKVEWCPRRHRCAACGAEFTVTDYDFRCGKCGEERTEFVSGDELELGSLEMEEYESSTAGKESVERE
jgi:hydrogenase nickel incorporation protein HypA/HybF